MLKKVLSLITLSMFLVSSNVLAVAPDRRISDNDGDVLNVNSDGSINVTGVATTPTGTGFVHVNNGTQDGAARSVTLASSDVTSPTGTGFLYSANARVDSAPRAITLASADVTSPTGAGFLASNNGRVEGAPRAVNLASADVTGTLAVGNGGTGAASLTDGGILLGSGTGAITALGVAANGQIPIGDGTTDPVLANLTGTASEIDVTDGIGSITIGIVDPLAVAKGGTAVATVSNDSLLVGNNAGTGFDQPALPDCADTGGNHLNYTALTGNFTCGTSGASASGWTDGGPNVGLSTSIDNVVIGGANNLGKLTVSGDSDIIQTVIRGHTTQTNPLLTLEEDSGFDIFNVSVNPSLGNSNNLAAGLTAGDSLTSGQRNTMFGINAGTAMVSANDLTALGYNAGAAVTGEDITAIGSGAGDVISSGVSNTCVGLDACGALTTGNNVTALGANAGLSNTGNANTYIGSGAAQSATTASNSVFIGTSAAGSTTVTANAAIVIGQGAASALTGGNDLIAIGADSCDAVTTGQNVICLGQLTTVQATLNSQMAVGRGAETTAANMVSFGGDGAYALNTYYLGESVTNATPVNTDINATGGAGTNINGGSMTLAAGKNTGAGEPGKINFSTGTTGASGTTLSSLSVRMVVSSDRLQVKTQQSAAPSSPAAGDIYYDTDTNELCVYNGSVWTGIIAAGSCA